MKEKCAHSPAVQKAIRLVEYLTRVALLRSKLIRDISEYETLLWISDVPHEGDCFAQAWGRDEEHERDEWLEVQNRREPELPVAPPLCKGWVNLSISRETNQVPELFPEITVQTQNPDWRPGSNEPQVIPQTERLEDHPEVQEAWECYIRDEWFPWTEEHKSWEKVHKVYSALFAIHQAQVRLGEEYELVLGLGLLTWQTPTGQRVRRHLVVADAFLDFEARLGKFIVRAHPEGAKLRPELDMLEIEEQPARGEETARSALIGAEDDPWDQGCVEGVLQALVHSIDSHGNYDASLETKGTRASVKPVVEYAPALILRKRSGRGLTETLKRIRERIENGEEIPKEFADLAEIQPESDPESSDAPGEPNAAFEGEVFFPKLSNAEQRRIVDKIRTASGVLVQGPPGTGKSHTIANLIAHLLATGQRILVTAKTPRALQVLMGSPEGVGPCENERDHGLIDKGMRSLCVSLLGSGMDEKKSLESSVGGILRKNDEWNEDAANLERQELERDLRNLREENARISRRLRDIRESEIHTRSIAEGTYRGTAARIAEAVNRNRATCGWFSDSVPLDASCPVHANELQRALLALRQFTQEKRRELNLSWPQALPTPDDFNVLVKNENSAAEDEANATSRADEHIADLLVKKNPAIVEAIRDGLSSFRDLQRRLLTTRYRWMSDAVRDVLGGNILLWRELLHVTREAISLIADLVVAADNANIVVPDPADLSTLRDDARILKDYIEKGGKLGWWIFRPDLVKKRLYLIRSVKINGHRCSTAEHFSILADALHVQIECQKAWGLWVGRSEKEQGPYALQVTALKSLCDALAEALTLVGEIANCRKVIRQFSGLSDPVWADESQVQRTISSCHLALARIRRRRATDEVQRLEMLISRAAAENDVHPVTADLIRAVQQRDTEQFVRCANCIQNLDRQRQHLRKLDEHLSKLRGLLPKFTESMEQTCTESCWETRVERINDAWHWAHARYWIEEYIRQEDVPALASRAKQIEGEINLKISKLASLHAWSFCFSRLKENHRRHMEAWQLSMRQLGKGTGKYARRHRREAQEHLNDCREAIPAWVMPLHRVWDAVHPAPRMFDVIIVDEASQCGLEAIPLFYLGKRILIVGDDKQISPDAVGLPRDAVHQLMEEFLHDFQFKSTFDIESSLFDHGKRQYGTNRIVLREHFRCMPEIIRFSNDLCYSDTPLIPLRQYGPNRLPPLEHVFVSNGYREGSNNRVINRPEAEAIVERIIKMCGDDRYHNKTMGVVVLQGEAQAGLIESQLLERIGAEEMERRRLVCGNPYSFQGDERDVIVLSLVAASNDRIGPLTKASDERRFNVAASRARDQMILFHSVTCEDLSTSCLRRKLLEFFQNPRSQDFVGIERDELERRATTDSRSIVKPPAPFDSWFEVDVALELLRRGFTVLPQFQVAGKRIDLVVEGGIARLAIECDGDKWHGGDRFEDDMQRQRQLERCGWEFFRVRESIFYADREMALMRLWRVLDERRIFPKSQHANVDREPSCEEVRQDAPKDSTSPCGDEMDAGAAYLFERPETEPPPSARRAEDLTPSEIKDAIVHALARCPNHSCTTRSLARRVLKELSILTRGGPRRAFESRIMRYVSALQKDGHIEAYKAKNRRVRLVSQPANS